MPLEDDVERAIVAAIQQHVKGDPAPLARAILETLWEAGYVTRAPGTARPFGSRMRPVIRVTLP